MVMVGEFDTPLLRLGAPFKQYIRKKTGDMHSTIN